MRFLIQQDCPLNVDMLMIKELLDNEKFTHEYEMINLENLANYNAENVKDMIPMGTVEFVETYFKNFHEIERENPIEIPVCLRTDEFLKRKYSIVKYENLPKNGEYFIKDVTQLKSFSYCGKLECLNTDMDRSHLYQVSEFVNILSEYRIYILDGSIYAVVNYNGNPCIFPDMNLINKANLIYSVQKDYPKSYTMDIMITDKGSSIIECHTLFSTGLYSTIWGTNWLYGYRDSKDYILNYNTKIEEW